MANKSNCEFSKKPIYNQVVDNSNHDLFRQRPEWKGSVHLVEPLAGGYASLIKYPSHLHYQCMQICPSCGIQKRAS
jgi:hypothetical protein